MNDPLREPFRGVEGSDNGYYLYLLIVECLGVMAAVFCGACLIAGVVLAVQWLWIL